MKFLYRALTLSILSTIFFSESSFALPSLKQNKDQQALPTVLKADEIDGDKISNVLTATGNVEASKGSSVIFADKMIYDKNGGMVRTIGHVRMKNIEIGNVRSSRGEMKDDFSKGVFFDNTIFFNDGSYLTSPEIHRETPSVTVLKKSVFSICPNEEISADNDAAGEKRDMLSIKSSKATIDRESSVMKMNHGIIKFYDVPVLYIPYFRMTLPGKDRKTGFLPPSYVKSTNLGFGLRTPFYVNIAPNMDLTITPFLGISSQEVMINNEFRHINSYGTYKTSFEIANNKLSSNANNNTTVVTRTKDPYRWNFSGSGLFDFTKDVGADFSANTVSDRNYLRDYYFNYLNYTTTKINLDDIHGRNYNSVKTIKFQELENPDAENAAPWVLPSFESHIETKPNDWKGKFALGSNATAITRGDGLQYRRITAAPEVNLPVNWNGNLFNFNSKLQGDFYSLENNFKSTPPTNDYNSTQYNYKPEASVTWRLPMMRKGNSSTIVIEPIADFVISSYKKNFSKLPNEDSNNTELGISNLFVTDRISGYDRNEAGRRTSFGVKTSLFNQYGEFGLTAGQSYRKSAPVQDVQITGFGVNNKSNIVGQAMYKARKYFSMTYSFQLNESNYRNDVNQLNTLITVDRLTFSGSYLLLRKNTQNAQEAEQVSFGSSFQASPKWKFGISVAQDMVLKRTLARSLTVNYTGCCALIGFSVVETNPSALTKPQRSFNLSLSFKNL